MGFANHLLSEVQKSALPGLEVFILKSISNSIEFGLNFTRAANKLLLGRLLRP
jgi:hypothetical protein